MRTGLARPHHAASAVNEIGTVQPEGPRRGAVPRSSVLTVQPVPSWSCDRPRCGSTNPRALPAIYAAGTRHRRSRRAGGSSGAAD